MLAWIVIKVGLVQCAFEGAFVLTLPLRSPRGERVEGCMSMETLHGLSAFRINPFFSNPIESQGMIIRPRSWARIFKHSYERRCLLKR